MALYELTPRALVEGLRRRLKKSLGQNFLVDENITRAISREVSRFCPEKILEIGPGAGALTLALCSIGRPIHVIEKDSHCARYVREIFGTLDSFEVTEGDALEVDVPSFCRDAGERALLVSNLPYNVASQIYFRYVAEPLVGMVLMFQREVARRFTALPGSGAYGILSVIGQYHHDIETVLDVPPECFVPAPKVTSTVLRFSPRPRELPLAEEPRFFAFVHAAFSLRRKTLANSLSGFGGLDKARWAARLEALGFAPNVRAEALTRSDFLCIFRDLQSQG